MFFIFIIYNLILNQLKLSTSILIIKINYLNIYYLYYFLYIKSSNDISEEVQIEIRKNLETQFPFINLEL
jgi:hypothetical protein